MLGIDPHELLRADDEDIFPPDGTPSPNRSPAIRRRTPGTRLQNGLQRPVRLAHRTRQHVAHGGEGKSGAAGGHRHPDIYGFESLLENGFEQLFINCERKAQFLFTRSFRQESSCTPPGHTMGPERLSLERSCLQLIEGANGGPFLLDEECPLPRD